MLSQSTALSCLGGIGKTQLALEYAYRYTSAYTAIFSVTAETAESLFSGFLALAELLNLSEKHDPQQQRIIAAVLHWLSQHHDWLLIFDNVEEIGLLKAFLPPVQQGALLLTSRKQAFDFIAHLLQLETLPAEEGLQLLLRRARWDEASSSPEEEAAARAIVASMDGLPLALDQAGAYLEAIRCRPSEYLLLLQTSLLPLLAERESYAEHPLSVTRTFQLAFQQVEALNPEASELLSVCAFLAPEAIPDTFFLEGASTLGSIFVTLAKHPLRFQAVLKTLLSYSLIQRHPTSQTITVHRLVQAILKARLSPTDRENWQGRVLVTLTRLFPAEDVVPHYWQVCERLLPHAQTLLTEEGHSQEEESDFLLLMNYVAGYLRKRSRYAEALSLSERALQRAEQIFGREHPLIAYALHGLATIHLEEGNYSEARLLFEQAIAIREQKLGASHMLLAVSLSGLAVLFCQQHDFASGRLLLERTVSIFEQALGPANPRVALMLNNLATVTLQQGEYEQAELLYQRARRIIEQHQGADHPDIAVGLHNLASMAARQGKYEQARPLYEQAIAIYEHTLGPEHPRLAFPLGGLADLLVLQGHYEQAEPVCQRALTIRQQAFGPEHPTVAYTLGVLANLYRGQRKYEQAEQCYQSTLHVYERVNHAELVTVLHDFALLREAQGRLEEAASLREQAARARKDTSKSD